MLFALFEYLALLTCKSLPHPSSTGTAVAANKIFVPTVWVWLPALQVPKMGTLKLGSMALGDLLENYDLNRHLRLQFIKPDDSVAQMIQFLSSGGIILPLLVMNCTVNKFNDLESMHRTIEIIIDLLHEYFCHTLTLQGGNRGFNIHT
jgi:hypothetical protein